MLPDETQKRFTRGALVPGGPDHHQRDANRVGLNGPQDDTATAQIAHTGGNECDALTSLDQSQKGLHHVGLIDHAWREPGAAAEADDRVEEIRGPRTMEKDERFVDQLLHGHHGAGRSPMPFGRTAISESRYTHSDRSRAPSAAGRGRVNPTSSRPARNSSI